MANQDIRTLTVQGKVFTVFSISHDREHTYYDIRCPDGETLDDSDGYEKPPTDAQIHEVAGIYFSEVVPQLRENAILDADHNTDELGELGMFGGS